MLDINDRVSVKVNFEKMTQKNTKTGWEKRLRCAVKGDKDKDTDGSQSNDSLVHILQSSISFFCTNTNYVSSLNFCSLTCNILASRQKYVCVIFN